MKLVLFDLDHTLLNGDTQSEWGCYLADLGIIDLANYQKAMAVFSKSYDQGELDIQALIEYQLKMLKSYSLSTIHEWCEEFVQERIRPLIIEAGWRAVAEHKNQGDELILITATNELLTAPIGILLGIQHLIAPKVEYDAHGELTGRCCGIPSYREGKVTRFHQWLEQQGKTRNDYEKILFYSDSHNDLPLLSLVDEPIIVNPDPKLREHALHQRWTIVDFGIKQN